MKKGTLLIIATLLIGQLFAQNFEHKDYSWEANRKPFKLTEKEQQLAEIVLKNNYSYEFFYAKDGNLKTAYIHHKIVRVNSDKAIELNNKIYIPSASGNVLEQRARVISKAGKITEVKEDKIVEVKDDNGNLQYKYFAMEGVEMGSEIEYFFITLSTPTYTGSRVRLQDEYPSKNVDFEIISPNNLKFTIKSYNGLPNFETDTVIEDKNRIFLSLKEIPALEKEEIAKHKANLQQLIFKLDENTGTGVKGVINYAGVADWAYKLYYSKQDKTVAKKIKKLLKEINIDATKSKEEQIFALENYLKSNYYAMDVSNSQLSDLNFVLDNKLGNETGITKLYIELIRQLNFKHELVYTSDRSIQAFDKEFEAYNFLTETIIYFPGIDKYMAPTKPSYRLGYVPFEATNNYGLFIKTIKIGDYEAALGKVKFIDAIGNDKSYQKIFIDFTIDDSFDVQAKVKDYQFGYKCSYIQPYFNDIKEDKQKETLEGMLNGFYPEAEFENVKAENGEGKYFGREPFIISASMPMNSLVENAGNKYLFKVGDAIGPQMEMYQEKERVQDLYSHYNRTYHHEITFNIPEGYVVKNLDDLKMDVFYKNTDNRNMSFTSSYTVTGNKVKVVIDEYYKQIEYKASEYNDYRRVINAAADFNKVVLIFEKK